MMRSPREFRTGAAVLCLLSLMTARFDAPNANAQSTTNPGLYREDSDRSGYSAATLPTPLSVIWQNTGALSDENKSAPVADGGVVFYATGGVVYAVSEVDGSIKWRYPATDINDPDVRKPGLFHGPPCVADGKVFIGNDDGYLYVLDENTGEDVFQTHTGGPILSAPIVDSGVVYFGSVDGKLYDIREDNQQPAWGGNFRAQGPVLGPAIVTTDQVIFADTNNSIYDAAKASGRLLWSFNAQGGVVESSPIMAGGKVVFGSDKYLIALSSRTGQIIWQAPLETVVTNQPATNADGTEFYVPTADFYLNAVNSRGTVLWRAHLDSPAAAGAIAIGSSVVIASKSGTVAAYDAQNGSMQWEYNIHAITPPNGDQPNRHGAISGGPLVEDGKLFVLGNDSTLTAFSTTGVDQVPPTADLQYPTDSKSVGGAQIDYAIKLQDVGSGIDPHSVVLKVDGKIIPTEYSPATLELEVKMVSAGQLFGSTPVALATLTSGLHVLTLTAADWRGNVLTKTWRFTVDPKLNPANAPLPTTNTGNYATQSGTLSELGASASDGGFSVPGGSGGSNSGNGSSGGGSSNGSNGGTLGGGGGTPPSSPPPSTAPPSQPPPTAPPGAGGGAGGFPPPPPI